MGLINFISRIIVKFTKTIIVLALLVAVVVGFLYYTDFAGSRDIIVEKYQIISTHYSNGEEYLTDVK